MGSGLSATPLGIKSGVIVMTNIIGWILYIICILYSISGLLYSREQVKTKGSVSYSNLTILFFTICISIIFAFVKYEKFNLIWLIPICVIIGFSPLSKLVGTAMLYVTFFLFKNKSEPNLMNPEKSKLDIETLLNKIDSYFSKGDFNSVIQLCENAIKNHIEDYRLYSALSRCYRRQLPLFLIDYNSLTNNQLKQYINHITKSIQYGEQTLLYLLNNNLDDEDLVLTTYALDDLNDALTINISLISQVYRRNVNIDCIKNLNNNLKEKLLERYEKGFSKFDRKFENYKSNENLYKEFNKLSL